MIHPRIVRYKPKTSYILLNPTHASTSSARTAGTAYYVIPFALSLSKGERSSFDKPVLSCVEVLSMNGLVVKI
jgi:hypothetical protein